jgi:hypothetical protein
MIATYPQPNEFGVYDSGEAEKLTYRHKRTDAEIVLLEIEPGSWISSVHVQLENCGMGEPLSKTGRRCCDTRESALMAAVERLINYAEHTDTKDAPQVVRWANSQKQMTLF